MMTSRRSWLNLLSCGLILLLATSDMVAGEESSTSSTCSANDGICSANTNTNASESASTSTSTSNLQQQQQQQQVSNCQDEHANCYFWAEIGECEKNPNWMKKYCRVSCNTCNEEFQPSSTTTTSTTSVATEADGSTIVVDDDLELGTDFGVAQTIALDIERNITPEQVKRRIRESRDYLAEASKTTKKEIMEMCRNSNAQCTFWALIGECEKNQPYMKKECAAACHSCDYLSIEGRCPIDPDAVSVWGPGDLEKTFQKLTQEPYKTEYQVKVLSSPATNGPWVITMENVVSEIEAERLIELGGLLGYEQSQNVGKLLADGTYERVNSTTRTSKNAWCNNECYKDEHAQAVINRLSNFTDIPEMNSEYLQLLRYEEGQFYKIHHDYIDIHLKRQQGVRILTFYLYLNDVEEGGGTNFDKLDITVMPKRGRAVLWPSVFDDKPNDKDGRTTHQALPVIKGVKYGANAWFHQFDFKTPNEIHCQ